MATPFCAVESVNFAKFTPKSNFGRNLQIQSVLIPLRKVNRMYVDSIERSITDGREVI